MGTRTSLLGNGCVVLYCLCSTPSRICFSHFRESVLSRIWVLVRKSELMILLSQTAAGIVSQEIPGSPMKVGDEFKMMGCSLCWWVGQGENAREYKIKKEVEYTKMVL